MPEPGSGVAAPVAVPDRRELAAAVVLSAAGGGLALLAAARTWSTVTLSRAAPLGLLRVEVTGRTLQPAVTGLAVVALAGVLALLATRAVLRRVIGAVLVLAGVGIVWRALLGSSAVSDARARQLVTDSRTGVALGAVRRVEVVVGPAWIALAVLGGVLVLAGGGLTVVRGGRWRAMSARYDSPVGPASAVTTDTAPTVSATPARSAAAAGSTVTAVGGTDSAAREVARARADLALWQQLDRGEDPTVGQEATVEPPVEPQS